MSEVMPPSVDAVALDTALAALVERGTITAEQRAAILAEVAGAGAPPSPAAARRRRSVADMLVEAGAYVGSALVLAAAVVLTAQNWEDLSESTRIAATAATALVSGIVGAVLARRAVPGSARRRLAGVVLTGTALCTGGTVALVLGDTESTGVIAVATILAVLVAAQLAARSAVTEIGMFVAGYALIQVTGEWLRPQGTLVTDEFGGSYYDTASFDRWPQLAGLLYGVLWAWVIARWLMHRELAVALGLLAALAGALPLLGMESSRPLGLVAAALLAALGFWRFMVEGFWPWLAAAIASVTAFVFWLVGGSQQPALAILVAGLVLLGSSALGRQVARRRRSRALEPRDPTGRPAPAGTGAHPRVE
jgi:hypothetical protein